MDGLLPDLTIEPFNDSTPSGRLLHLQRASPLARLASIPYRPLKMRSAVTISLVPESRGGPFVFWDDLAMGCERAAVHRFDAVEIFAPSADAVNVPQLRSLLDRHQLAVAGFGTGAGWVKHKLRLTDPDPAVRRKAVEFISEIIQLGAQFGAPAIIGSMQGRWSDGISRDQTIEWLAAALTELGSRAADCGVALLYEPLNRYETDLFCRVDDALGFLRPLDAPNVKLLCDLFHMNIEETDIAAALCRAGNRVGHIHWADSNRQAIGFGHTDVAPIVGALQKIGYGGYLSAEILPLPDSDAAAKQTIESIRRISC
jgi:sugar phosphate isomerase/epimerase